MPSSDPRPGGSHWHSPPKLYTPPALWATRQTGTQEGSSSASSFPEPTSAQVCCAPYQISNARIVLGLHFYAKHSIMSPFKQEQYIMLQFSYFKGEVTSIWVHLISGLPHPRLLQYRSDLGWGMQSRGRVGSTL